MTNTTARSARIDAIINRRHPLVQRIAEVQAQLQAVLAACRVLDQMRDDMAGAIDDPAIRGQLSDLDLGTVQREIMSEQDALDRLRHRFARPTLNIGVVGRARQGKSRMLQSLSGLTSVQIPDGNRQHCTGVRSTIYHNPDVAPYADVVFYSERTFLDEIIAPYYHQLHLGIPPGSLDSWARQPLPDLPSGRLAGYAEPRAKYEHLRRYHQQLDQYRPLLQADSPRRIGPDEIRAYVAQDTTDGQRVLFNYLAVREVKIVCAFPHADIGQLAMIDLPGLGDTGVGDQERLLHTLSQDVDVVLFVRMPKGSGDYWADVDVQLYDLARQAIGDLPLERWSFMVLNRTGAQSSNGDNADNCADLRASTADKHIYVVEVLTADCADPAAVGQAVLERVLSHLEHDLPALDRAYAQACQERLNRLLAHLHVLIGRADQALGQPASGSEEFSMFQRKFDDVWNMLTGGLEALVRSLRDERATYNPIFRQKFDDAVQAARARPGLPTVVQIRERRDSLGSFDAAYADYLHELRTRLAHHFTSLDHALHDIIARARTRVVAVLASEGQLGQIIPTRDQTFIGELYQLIPEGLGHLRETCAILETFDLSYRGFMYHRIRALLDPLFPDTTPYKLSHHPSADELLDYLHTLHGETLYHIQRAAEGWETEPNAAVFAMIEEFVDQILRAAPARRQWEEFYYQMRADIWGDAFASLGERSRLRQQWRAAVARLAQASDGQLRFLLD